MPSDISNYSFDSEKNFSGVLTTQGSIILGADRNEQLYIQQHRTHTESIDVIGKSGVPKKSDAFKINVTGSSFTINPGHIYIEGLYCKLHGDGVVNFFNQPYYPYPNPPFDGIPSSPPNASPNLEDGTYLVYVNAWQREIGYLEHPEIREVALGEAHNPRRLKNVFQIKLAKVEANFKCNSSSEAWNKIIAPSTGRIEIRTVEDTITSNPCTPFSASGFRGLENQLYRIQIHKSDGNLSTSTLKWSRNNGSLEARIENIQGKILTVNNTGKDDVLAFTAGQWCEVVDEYSTFHNKSYPLVKIIDVNHGTREIEIESADDLPLFDENKAYKLVRWDQQLSNADKDGIPLSTNWITIENGIEVRFVEGTYKAGDNYLIKARVITSKTSENNNGLTLIAGDNDTPLGVEHKYCKLAALKVSGGQLELLEDCRPIFPQLSEICAEDICFENTNCKLPNATNVQEAIDELCQTQGGSCTFHVRNQEGWEGVFDLIQLGGDAKICFEVGVYTLKKSKIIEDKGHLILFGCGLGTKIVAANDEVALTFKNCESVSVRDMHIEAKSIYNKDKEHLNGALTCLDCKDVSIQNASFKCGYGSSPHATCVTIRNSNSKIGNVTIENSYFHIGAYQHGLLLVNIDNGIVENNNIITYQVKDKQPIYKIAQQDKRFRAEVTRWLISDISFEKNEDNQRIEVAISDQKPIYFKTDSNLANAWSKIISQTPTGILETTEDVKKYLEKVTTSILTERKYMDTVPQLKRTFKYLDNNNRDVAHKAIIFGGIKANNIIITNNNIKDSLVGIHIGLSTANNQMYSSNKVQISNNKINLTLLPFNTELERYGIFSGNAKSLIIEKNNIELERIKQYKKSTSPYITGIKVYGKTGLRMDIIQNNISSHNHFVLNNPKEVESSSFNRAIWFHPNNTKPAYSVWKIQDNVMVAKEKNSKDGNFILDSD